MNPRLKPYCSIVPFFELVLGPDYEIAVYDFESDARVVAIANNHISGIALGDTMPDFMVRAFKCTFESEQTWEANFVELAPSGKPLRSSIFTIRSEDDNHLIGAVVVSFDDSRFQAIASQIMELVHPSAFVQQTLENRYAPSLLTSPFMDPGSTDSSPENTLQSIIDQMIDNSPLTVEQMHAHEKAFIVDKLKRRGVFTIKGSVALVAKALHCSEPTIYRYISSFS